MGRAGIYCLILLLVGCAGTPYIAARHESDPKAEHDGWDFGCVGYKTRTRLNFKAGYCREFRLGDNLAEVEIEYELLPAR